MSSSAGVLLDTHVWFRYQVNPAAIRSSTLDVIDEAATRNAVFVSVISVWELAMLERAGRVQMEKSISAWTEDALSLPGIRLLTLTREIAIEAVALPEPMHKDPADRFLVASSKVEQLDLITSDKAILAFAKATKLACVRA